VFGKRAWSSRCRISQNCTLLHFGRFNNGLTLYALRRILLIKSLVVQLCILRKVAPIYMSVISSSYKSLRETGNRSFTVSLDIYDVALIAPESIYWPRIHESDTNVRTNNQLLLPQNMYLPQSIVLRNYPWQSTETTGGLVWNFGTTYIWCIATVAAVALHFLCHWISIMFNFLNDIKYHVIFFFFWIQIVRIAI